MKVEEQKADYYAQIKQINEENHQLRNSIQELNMGIVKIKNESDMEEQKKTNMSREMDYIKLQIQEARDQQIRKQQQQKDNKIKKNNA